MPFNLNSALFIHEPGVSNFSGNDIGQIITALLPNAIVLAGVFFLLLIIYGGFQLIVYGGQYNTPQRVSQSKNMITYGFIGFLIVVAAYFILQLIQYVTGINFTNTPIM